MIFERGHIDKNSTFARFNADFEEITQWHTYSKHHRLHHEDTVCNDLFIIQTGLARAFYHKDGQDITAHFAFEKTTITAIDSFIQRKRSRYTIELLEDATLATVSHKSLYGLLDEKPEYEKFVRIYLEQIYIDLAERVEDLLFNTAKERYVKLIEKYPDILQRVHLKHIASYVGITQETLSRIRAMKD